MEKKTKKEKRKEGKKRERREGEENETEKEEGGDILGRTKGKYDMVTENLKRSRIEEDFIKVTKMEAKGKEISNFKPSYGDSSWILIFLVCKERKGKGNRQCCKEFK